LKAYPAVISSSVERYRFREVELMNVARLEINIWLTKSLENDKTDEGRVQTQMYVAMQIAAALSAFSLSPLQRRNYQEF
jgi:methionyl-tRNA synthetase